MSDTDSEEEEKYENRGTWTRNVEKPKRLDIKTTQGKSYPSESEAAAADSVGAAGKAAAGKVPKTYVVERLLAARDTAYGREYRVHWADYSSAHDSWEPEENILDKELIDDFHQGVCGTFGCTLPDKHSGLHFVPDFGARKRKRPSDEPPEAPGKQQQQARKQQRQAPGKQQQQQPSSHKPDGNKFKAGGSSQAQPAETAKLPRPKLGGEMSGRSEVSVGPHHQAHITKFLGPTTDSDCGVARPEPVALPRRQHDLEVARSTAAALTLSAFGEYHPWVFVAAPNPNPSPNS